MSILCILDFYGYALKCFMKPHSQAFIFFVPYKWPNKLDGHITRL